MEDQKVLGLDLGATNIRGGLIHRNRISQMHSRRIQSEGTVDEVLEDIYAIVDLLIDKEVAAIGIGVPSVVDVDLGIVYDVQYIPSWKEVHLKSPGQLADARHRLLLWHRGEWIGSIRFPDSIKKRLVKLCRYA